MARNHARIFTRIWNDPDFLDLSADEQRLYLLLLSQQNLSHAGLLPLTVTRWANKSKDRTVEQIEACLQGLSDAKFVVIDTVTEELLVRSLMRGDEVWKHWKVMTAAARDVEAIASETLRVVTAGEVARMLAIPDLSGQARRLLEGLRDALPKPTDCQSVPDPDPMGQGYVTEVSTDDLPLPPSPAPTPAPAAFADDPTSQLLTEHVNAYTEPPPLAAQAAVKREIQGLVAEGVRTDRIRAGLGRLRAKRLAASLLPQLVSEADNAADRSRTEAILDRAMERATAAERRALP